MATKSIYKNLVIRDERLAVRLANALDSAKPKGKKVVLSKSCQEITGEKIKEIFGEK